jgi:SAM-dependent methyltransferase
MDIKEFSGFTPVEERHFWEQSKLAFIKRKILKYCPAPEVIADIGCGDGITILALSKLFPESSFWGIDSALTTDLADQIHRRFGGVKCALATDISALDHRKEIDLILLLDVLEHVENPGSFLDKIVPRLSGEGVMIISVPAYQRLFSAHDVFLGHYRRYNHAELIELLKRETIEIVESGYFFFSLLGIRFLQMIRRKIPQGKKALEVRSGMLNKMFAAALKVDILAGEGCRKFGIVLPGLSCYAVCRKRQPDSKRNRK